MLVRIVQICDMLRSSTADTCGEWYTYSHLSISSCYWW